MSKTTKPPVKRPRRTVEDAFAEVALLRDQLKRTISWLSEFEERIMALERSPLRKNREDLDEQLWELSAGSPGVSPFPM